MEFSNLIYARQSVRAYQPTPVPEEKLQALLEAANRAPSAGNFQAFEVYVVREAKHRQALAAATYEQDFVQHAPLSLVFCMHPARCQYQPAELYALQDTTIACTFAMLKATDLGLVSCWIGAFSAEKLAQALALPENVKAVAILAIGYAAETPERTSRRKLEDVVHRL
jgi:nitroreductase